MPTPIARLPFVDVHHPELTPAVYTLLFSDILIEKRGNDLTYNMDVWDRDDETDETPYADKAWEDRLKRGYSNCFHDSQAMKAFIENPCTWREALEEFRTWLKERGVQENETILVKIWW